MPPPSCIVRRWARSWPRKTRFETSERYSSCFRNSESNKGIVEHLDSRLGTSPSFLTSDGHRGRLDRIEDIVHHIVGLDVLGLALEVQDQPVSQGRAGRRADVLAGDVVAVIEDRPDLGREDDRLRPARARAVADVA